MKNPYKLNLSRYSTHSVIRSNIGTNETVLDVGCNDGYIGYISDNSNIFYGLDFLDESVKNAKKIYKDVMVYDLNCLNKLSWNIKFDTIIFADVLEHLLNPEEVLFFFVSNYLKENGKIIISLPNIANWQIRIKLLFGNFNYTETGILDKTHFHLYTFKSANDMIKKNNLETKKILSGASFFGFIIKIMPFLKTILATNIILVCKKNKNAQK